MKNKTETLPDFKTISYLQPVSRKVIVSIGYETGEFSYWETNWASLKERLKGQLRQNAETFQSHRKPGIERYYQNKATIVKEKMVSAAKIRKTDGNSTQSSRLAS